MTQAPQPAQLRNIFVAFELLHPEKGDDRVREAVEKFGCPWARINKNVFYLHGDLNANFVGTKVWASMNMDDKLVVIDTTKNDARWYNVKPEVSDFLMNNWHA